MAYYGFKPAEQAIQIGDNTIVSADIADGSIVNDDINSSAAIATSKLSGALTAVGSHGLATVATSGSADDISSGTLAAARVATLNQNTTGQAGTVATIAGLAPNTATTQATQGAITSLGTLTGLDIENTDGVQLQIHDSSDPGWGLKKDRVSSSENLYLGTMTKAGTFVSKHTFFEGGNVTFGGQCQASSFLTGDLILKSPTNNGHYTIWEEEDYLAIRNELKGKTYKFVLEEINE